jgi:hypothetical protein
MKPFLFLLLLSPCLFAATDTINGPGDPKFKGSVDLSTAFGDTAHAWNYIGWAENNIVFVKPLLPDTFVRIYDFGKIDSPKVLSAIRPITGSISWSFFRFKKYGSTIYFAEGLNKLRIFDVSDTKHPIDKGGITFNNGWLYDFVLYKNDTIIVDATFSLWYRFYYDHLHDPVMIDSLKNATAGQGPLNAIDGRYLNLYSNGICMWQMPVTARAPDVCTGQSFNDEFVANGFYVFAGNGSAKVFVYDISNPTKISFIDTLPNAGMHLQTCRNLLLVSHPNNTWPLRVYDISNINAISLAAVFNGKVRDFKMDSVTNYVYCLDSNKQTVNIVDLSKYIHQGTTISSNNPGVDASKAILPGICVSSKNGKVSFRYSMGTANKPAALCIYTLNGRMVRQTILSPYQTPSTFSFGSVLPCGIYLLRFSSGETVQTVKFVVRND